MPTSITPKEELTERSACKIYSPAAGTFIDDLWKKKGLSDVAHKRRDEKKTFGGVNDTPEMERESRMMRRVR